MKNGGLIQTTCSAGAAAQLFTRTTDASGNFTLSQSGICVSDTGGSLQANNCSGAADQKFKVESSMDGSSMIVGVGSGLCFNVAYNSSSAGTPIIFYSCSGYATNERFQFSQTQ
jgi:hypothetical protein